MKPIHVYTSGPDDAELRVRLSVQRKDQHICKNGIHVEVPYRDAYHTAVELSLLAGVESVWVGSVRAYVAIRDGVVTAVKRPVEWWSGWDDSQNDEMGAYEYACDQAESESYAAGAEPDPTYDVLMAKFRAANPSVGAECLQTNRF